jgi:hypothetical protein
MVCPSGFASISEDLSIRLPVVDPVESVEVCDTLTATPTDTWMEWCVDGESEPRRRVVALSNVDVSGAGKDPVDIRS